jgi:RNA polymerase sigma factor (sigma-70 family)
MDYEDFESKSQKPSERMPSDVDLTAIYLREVGSVPLLDRQEEVDLARQLLTARNDFAEAALKLPAACRSYLFNGDPPRRRKKQPWTLQQIEDCHDQLRSYLKEAPGLKKNKAYLSIVDAKRRLDRSRDAMIQANLRLVAHVAKKFCNQGLPFMDLVQEGNIGLMKAVEKFEHERGYKFSTYAFWWIKQAITRAIADKSRTIRVPVHLLEKVHKVQRASRELEKELGREPSPQEIADKAQMPLKVVVEILGSTPQD